MSYFLETIPNIEGNKSLRDPQIEAYIKIKDYFSENPTGEALVVLPTGTGKSGLISIAPYGTSNGRVLIITPGLVTKESILKTIHSLEDNFWIKHNILFNPEDLPVVEEYESEMLIENLAKCDFVVANIHKLYKDKDTSLLNKVPPDFFDMVIIDEAHHAPANTWQVALEHFVNAKKLHVTGTPYRGDDQKVPGYEIHNTSLSDAMRAKYVKWLRKETTNCSELFFIIPEKPGQKLTKEDVLKLKDEEWIQKSVALSEICSLEVIDHSISQLNKIKAESPNVPHKILAVACSISHAEDVYSWYKEKGMIPVIVHSLMLKEEQEKAFRIIENNECNVVVSVDMLKEGYDHIYLTVLAVFRPYRSKNAFAQIVGRVLRAIPEKEIIDHAIDNNAIVIYHEETGLDALWKDFQDEIDKVAKRTKREYTFTDREYKDRELTYAEIESGEYFIGGQDSYLADINFNEEFEKARNSIREELQKDRENFKNLGYDENTIDKLVGVRQKDLFKSKGKDLDALMLNKRPELARKKILSLLTTVANESVQDILEEKGIDPKETTLYSKFIRIIKTLPPNTPNDGILVRYINLKLFNKFGPVKKRSQESLMQSEKYLYSVIDELRRII